MFIVITGNVVDGLHFTGPFKDHDSALDYCGDLPAMQEWTIADLYDPEDHSDDAQGGAS